MLIVLLSTTLFTLSSLFTLSFLALPAHGGIVPPCDCALVRGVAPDRHIAHTLLFNYAIPDEGTGCPTCVRLPVSDSANIGPGVQGLTCDHDIFGGSTTPGECEKAGTTCADKKCKWTKSRVKCHNTSGVQVTVVLEWLDHNNNTDSIETFVVPPNGGNKNSGWFSQQVPCGEEGDLVIKAGQPQQTSKVVHSCSSCPAEPPPS